MQLSMSQLFDCERMKICNLVWARDWQPSLIPPVPDLRVMSLGPIFHPTTTHDMFVHACVHCTL